jgi:hypothetical protein
METVASEVELLHCFREIDRAEVLLAPELVLPLAVEGAVAWTVGPRAFLLFCDRPGRAPRGIVFHRNSGTVPDVAAMCEWCHAVRIHGGVKLMTVCSDERHRLGLYLCSDLACVGGAGRALQRIADFAARRLF